MGAIKRLCVRVLMAWVVSNTASPCAAQVNGVVISRTQYVYDSCGSLAGAQVVIQLPYRLLVLNMDRVILSLPVMAQLQMVDQQFGLGADCQPVAQVLVQIKHSLHHHALQRELERIQQMNNVLQRQRELQRLLLQSMQAQRRLPATTLAPRRR